MQEFIGEIFQIMLSIIGILVAILVPILLYVLNKEKGEYMTRNFPLDFGDYFRL